MPDIPIPQQRQAITKEDGSMQDTFRRWVELMTELDPIKGTGSPEGVVEARQTRQYMDDAGIASAILYIKRDNDIAGDKTKGWILV